jgi:ribosome recycling factor
MTIAEILKQAQAGMEKAVENTRREFSGVRSSKASTTLLDTVRVEAYGSMVALNQVALVATPEPRMITVQPFDKSQSPAIEKAIRDAGLGLNPSSQGAVIRVPLPMLSEERRRELVKICGKFAEEGRIAIRHARTEANSRLKKLEGISEDETNRAEKDVQKITDEAVHRVDELLKAKEAEVLEV